MTVNIDSESSVASATESWSESSSVTSRKSPRRRLKDELELSEDEAPTLPPKLSLHVPTLSVDSEILKEGKRRTCSAVVCGSADNCSSVCKLYLILFHRRSRTSDKLEEVTRLSLGEEILSHDEHKDGRTVAKFNVRIDGLELGNQIYHFDLSATGCRTSFYFSQLKGKMVQVRTPTLEPSRPRNLRCEKETMNWVSLKWDKPHCNGGCDLHCYVVQHLNADNQYEDVYTGKHRKCSIVNLKPGIHRFRVHARNPMKGSGDWSEPLAVELIPRVPLAPGQPLIEENANKVEISWSPPKEAPGVSFELQVRDSRGSFKTLYYGHERRYCLTDLQVDGDFDFRVRAVNSAGVSKFSETSRFQKKTAIPEAPARVSVTVSRHDLQIYNVEWMHDSDDGVEFAVEMQRENRDIKTIFRGAEMRCTIGPLLHGRIYRIRVMAKNEAGWSDPSPFTEFCVDSVVPLAPKRAPRVFIENEACGQLRFEWDRLPDASTGGKEISSYVLYMRKRKRIGSACIDARRTRPLLHSEYCVLTPSEWDAFCEEKSSGTQILASKDLLWEYIMNGRKHIGRNIPTESVHVRAVMPPETVCKAVKHSSSESGWKLAKIDSVTERGYHIVFEDGEEQFTDVNDVMRVVHEAEFDICPKEEMFQQVYRGANRVWRTRIADHLLEYDFAYAAENSLGIGAMGDACEPVLSRDFQHLLEEGTPPQIKIASASCIEVICCTSKFRTDWELCYAIAKEVDKGFVVVDDEFASKKVISGDSAFVPVVIPGSVFVLRTRHKIGQSWSIWSLPIVAKAPVITPGKPHSLMADLNGNGAVHVSWTKPVQDGGDAIQGYHLECSDDGDDDFQVAHRELDFIPSETFAFKDARPGSRMRFRVRALNNVGHGEFTEPVTLTIDPISPGRISADTVRFKSITQSSAFVAWDLPDDNGGCRVECFEVEATWGNVKFMQRCSTLKILLRNLEPASQVFVRIRARNAIGWGEWSEKAFVRTLESPQQLETPRNLQLVSEEPPLLKWDPVREPEVEYVLQLSKSTSMLEKRAAFVTCYNGKEESFFLKNIEPEMHFRGRVQSKKDGIFSPFGKELTFSTGPRQLSIRNRPGRQARKETEEQQQDLTEAVKTFLHQYPSIIEPLFAALIIAVIGMLSTIPLSSN